MADVVAVTLFTSPWCPFSWAAEPSWRRILYEFDGDLSVTYVLKDLSHDWRDLPGFASSWLDAAASSGQPTDPRMLLSDPPASPVPANLAVRAVAEQTDAGPYLRAVRERIMTRGFRADRGDALFALAREVGGIDEDRLDIAFRSNATIEAAAADHERCAEQTIPALSVAGGDPLEDPRGWRDALLAAGARSRPIPDAETALRALGSATTPEMVEVCGRPGPVVPAELWKLAAEWRVRVERLPGGEVWAPA